jgi:hypothetical protein
LWALAQQDKSKIGEIFGVENIEAVCEELEGEMEKMQKVESLANTIQKNKGRGEGEKRKEDEEAWRGWVEKVYLPRLGKEKEEGGGWKSEEERVKVCSSWLLRKEGFFYWSLTLPPSLPPSQPMHKANPSLILRK